MISFDFSQEYKTYKENFLKRFQLTKLPPYLIFCIKRFTKNNFFVEKNPTIVNFPITCVTKDKLIYTLLDISMFSVNVFWNILVVKTFMHNRNVDLREYLTEEAQATEKFTTYNLVANVVHDGKPTEGSYRIHVLHHVSVSPALDSIPSVAVLLLGWFV